MIEDLWNTLTSNWKSGDTYLYHGILYDIANGIWQSQCPNIGWHHLSPLYIYTYMYVYVISYNVLYNIWYVKTSTAVGFHTQSSNVHLPILPPPLIPPFCTILIPFCSIITLYPCFLSDLYFPFLKSYIPHSCLHVSCLLCAI